VNICIPLGSSHVSLITHGRDKKYIKNLSANRMGRNHSEDAYGR